MKALNINFTSLLRLSAPLLLWPPALVATNRYYRDRAVPPHAALSGQGGPRTTAEHT
jgi:hypothetical protein